MRFISPTTWLCVAILVASVKAQSDPCAEFEKAAKIQGGYEFHDANLFRKCILNVPFNKTAATITFSGVRKFLAMSSSTIYYADPTPELELVPFSLNKTLDTIEAKINDGKYENNWSFDYDMVQMFQMFRDGHTDYETRCTHGYMYEVHLPIIALAGSRGTPEVYHVKEIKNGNTKTGQELGQKIVKINGQDPGFYISDYIKNTPEQLDWIDPDARFNAMMYNWPAGSWQGRFSYRNMWDGEDIKITWENGTVETLFFTVAFTSQMVKVTDDGAGWLMFSDTKSMTELCMTPIGEEQKLTKYINNSKRSIMTGLEGLSGKTLVKRGTSTTIPPGYPKDYESFFVYNQAMITYSLTGDKQTVVLVLRKFIEPGSNVPDDQQISSDGFIRAFSNYIRDQLLVWKSKGYTRLIIDVSGNNGGKAILPFDLLKRFFPASEEFLHVNMRYSPLTWAYLHSQKNGREYDDWRRLDGTDFADFKDFVGPLEKDGDLFTRMWRQDYVQFGRDDYGLDMESYPTTNPFMPDDIAIVSDALCASACHSFVEGMRARGVRTYAYGGRSSSGPMQALGGTKGGKVIGYDDAKGATDMMLNNATTISYAGPRNLWELPKIPIGISQLIINSENKFREGYTVPTQFLYTPACNRFYLTKEMFSDPRKMWEKVRDMAWDKEGKVIACAKYEFGKDSKMKDYKLVNTTAGAQGYDVLDEGTPVDGSKKARNSKDAKFSSEQNYKNLGQVIWKKMGRKDRK